MHGKKIRSYAEHISYNLRRAEEERDKSEKALSARDRAGRLEMAEIFRARAAAMPTLH